MDTTFAAGDVVGVVRAARLPRVELIGSGVIERVTDGAIGPLYWVRGFACARTASVLRHLGRCGDCGAAIAMDSGHQCDPE